MYAVRSLRPSENERQWSINNFWFCIIRNLSCVLLQTVISSVLAAFIGNKVGGMVTAHF
jgi:hypothetical protein